MLLLLALHESRHGEDWKSVVGPVATEEEAKKLIQDGDWDGPGDGHGTIFFLAQDDEYTEIDGKIFVPSDFWEGYPFDSSKGAF